MKLTVSQWFGIANIILGALVGGAGQLADIGLSQGAVKSITAASGLLIVIVGGIGTLLTGQRAQIVSVANLEGVEHIRLNDKASPDLMTMAANRTDRSLEKIVPPKGPPPADKN